ncbi:MAG: DNA primase [Firmicutes bacterium]|nr:DNA primase [Bacillota bacterium]
MNSNRNNEIIQEIKAKNDIVSVISEYVSLKRSGRSFVGLCPFHNEKTPSFNVNQDKQFFYCFGCGVGGDVFSFMMKIENLEFKDAAKRLAERAGVDWPEFTAGSEANRRKEVYFKINHLAAALYSQYLLKTDAGNIARNYLTKRGIRSELWQKFQLGYAPPSWDTLTDTIRKKGLPLQPAEELGLVVMGSNGYYDRFRNRIIFPITDSQGRIVGFGGRLIEAGEPKYLNSPENILFHKGKFLYGLSVAKDSIRRAKKGIIVEGYLDVIQAHQAGFTNTVASLGTALTREQARLFKRFAPEVILAYDADTAGQNATLRGMDILDYAGLTVRVLKLPPGYDPDSFIKDNGGTEFKKRLDNAQGLIDFKISSILSKYDLSAFQGKKSAVEEILPVLSAIDNDVVREHYLRMIVRETGFSENAVQTELRKWRSQNRLRPSFLDRKSETSYTNQISSKASAHNVYDHSVELSPLQKAIFEAEKELLQSALQEYDKLKRINEELKPEEFRFEIWRNLFLQIKELIFLADNTVDTTALINELGGGVRETAAALLAEKEIKNRTFNFEQIINYLKMLHLKEKIEALTMRITTGRNDSGQTLTDDETKQLLAQITELNRTLKRDYPQFSGL